MTVQTQEFVRKTFKIQAVQVTEDNINEVAKWCSGEVKTALNGQGKTFIEVNVKKPMSDRQKQAFVGDWVLYNKSGYKVYTDRAFNACFEAPPSPIEQLFTEQDIAAGAREREASIGDDEATG